MAKRAAKEWQVRVVITPQDINAQRTAEKRPQLSAALFQHGHEGVLITDANYRVLDADPTFSSITGYSLDGMRGAVPALTRPAAEGYSTVTQPSVMRDSLKASGISRGRVVAKRRNGNICTLQFTISAVKGRGGVIRFDALALSDITEARLQRELLERQAQVDELTGLPHRALGQDVGVGHSGQRTRRQLAHGVLCRSGPLQTRQRPVWPRSCGPPVGGLGKPPSPWFARPCRGTRLRGAFGW